MPEQSSQSDSAVRTSRWNIQVFKRLPGAFVKQFALLVLTLSILFPLFFMFNNSFKQREEYFRSPLSLPQVLTWQNYVNVIQHPHLLDWFINSLMLTFFSVGICTLAAILAAYAFAQMQFAGRNLLFSLMMPLMVIPPIVMIIPLFVLFQRISLVNNPAGPIFIYAGLMMPFTIYLLRNFFLAIPREIQEAALIDGCTSFQLLRLIFLPLSRPAIFTSVLVNAVWVWNELLIALVFLQTEELRTLIVGISASLQKRFTLDVPALMAGLAIATLPMLLLYIVGQRVLVRGLVAGFEK